MAIDGARRKEERVWFLGRCNWRREGLSAGLKVGFRKSNAQQSWVRCECLKEGGDVSTITYFISALVVGAAAAPRACPCIRRGRASCRFHLQANEQPGTPGDESLLQQHSTRLCVLLPS